LLYCSAAALTLKIDVGSQFWGFGVKMADSIKKLLFPLIRSEETGGVFNYITLKIRDPTMKAILDRHLQHKFD